MNLLLSGTLRRLSRLYNKMILKEFPDFNSEYCPEILLYLSSNDKPSAQKHLAEHLHLDKSRVALLIEKLNEADYTYTERNPIDRREHLVYLTDKGRQLLPEIELAISKANTLLEQQLNGQSLASFYNALMQLELSLSD